MPQPIKACGVLVVRGDPPAEFLLMEHPARLDLPKGHLDGGESELECALRELYEETGIRRKDIELDPLFRWETQYPVRNKRSNFEEALKTLVIFLGWLRKPVKIKPSEHEGFRWTPWRPPHRIQPQTIDPLLASVELYLQQRGSGGRPATDAARD